MSDVLCEVLTPKEAWRITRLPRRVLRQMNAEGTIRAGQLPGGALRYWREDIERLIERDLKAQDRLLEMDEKEVG